MVLNVIEAQETLDELFKEWGPSIGPDYLAYRDHAYRAFNLSCALGNATGFDREKPAIASPLHDIGIWLDNIFD